MMKWGNLSGAFSSFIIHPSTLLPAADLAAFAKEWFSAKCVTDRFAISQPEGNPIFLSQIAAIRASPPEILGFKQAPVRWQREEHPRNRSE